MKWTLLLYLLGDPVVMPALEFSDARQCEIVKNKVVTSMSKKVVGAECAHISFNQSLDLVRTVRQ